MRVALSGSSEGWEVTRVRTSRTIRNLCASPRMVMLKHGSAPNELCPPFIIQGSPTSICGSNKCYRSVDNTVINSWIIGARDAYYFFAKLFSHFLLARLILRNDRVERDKTYSAERSRDTRGISGEVLFIEIMRVKNAKNEQDFCSKDFTHREKDAFSNKFYRIQTDLIIRITQMTNVSIGKYDFNL